MKIKRGEISKAVLSALAVAGIVTVAVLAPNLFSVLGNFHKPIRKFNKNQIRKSVYQVKKSKLISMKELATGETEIKLTKKGKEKILIYKLETIKLDRTKKWDKKWRIVIFDIPEEFKHARRAFMYKLKEIGFVSLQKSVFITPYPCEDEIEFLKDVYLIKSYVSVIIAEKVDKEDKYRKLFKI
ncbi:MAG: hypothetical protein Q8P83_01250 [bacterium]|nr:hypothetical protein [bacterium]